jgi:hypothetical protein
MSDQQPTTTSTATGNTGEPDNSEPTLERQAELRAAYEANVAAGRAPYAAVEIRTWGDIRWIRRERGWSVQPSLEERLNLSGAIMYGADLSGASLELADLSEADLSGANLSGARLDGVDLSGADLRMANLSGARLNSANLSGADLGAAKLSGADLYGADLSGADLRMARMDVATVLTVVILSSTTQLGDVVWNGVPLTQVEWSRAPRLGDEKYIKKHDGILANMPSSLGASISDRVRIESYRNVARAYRQLATILRDQGLNDEADRYAYRAQVVRRRMLVHQGKGLRYLGSLLLWLIAGYGYKPLRSFLTYGLVVVGFALAYFLLGTGGSHMLTWNESIVVSMTAFHGRGFFASAFQPGDPQAAVAAVEALFGLFIEITFIATFTQRFFAR